MYAFVRPVFRCGQGEGEGKGKREKGKGKMEKEREKFVSVFGVYGYKGIGV